MSNNTNHIKAMDLCQEAILKLSEALTLERSCIEELERLEQQASLSYVVLCRSAATIAVNRGHYETALVLCKKGLIYSGQYPEIKEELLNVVAVANFLMIRFK